MFRRKDRQSVYRDFTLKYKGATIRVSNFLVGSIHESFAIVKIDEVSNTVYRPLTQSEVLDALKKGKPIN